MTCIIGVAKRGTVYLGGDSAGTSGDLSQRVIGDKKVFKRDKYIFGICGLPKVMDALRYAIELPVQEKGSDDRQFVAAELLPAIKAGLKEYGCTEHEGEKFHGAILFGYRGKLYRIESNFQVITNAYEFDAVGSGADIAMGSLHATTRDFNVRNRILKALEASAINNAGVRPPFTIVSVK